MTHSLTHYKFLRNARVPAIIFSFGSERLPCSRFSIWRLGAMK